MTEVQAEPKREQPGASVRVFSVDYSTAQQISNRWGGLPIVRVIGAALRMLNASSIEDQSRAIRGELESEDASKAKVSA